METAMPAPFDQSKIIYAISKTMTCDICPYPCTLGRIGSLRTCHYHWHQILENIGREPWVNGLDDKLFKLFSEDEKGGMTYEQQILPTDI